MITPLALSALTAGLFLLPDVLAQTASNAPALADLDGDGQEELIVVKYLCEQRRRSRRCRTPVVYYYKGDSATLKFTRHTIVAPVEDIALGRQHSVVDLNGDARELL